MSRIIRLLPFIPAILCLIVSPVFATKKGFNRAAKGKASTTSGSKGKGGDKTGAAGRSANRLKPIAQTKISKPKGPQPR